MSTCGTIPCSSIRYAVDEVEWLQDQIYILAAVFGTVCGLLILLVTILCVKLTNLKERGRGRRESLTQRGFAAYTGRPGRLSPTQSPPPQYNSPQPPPKPAFQFEPNPAQLQQRPHMGNPNGNSHGGVRVLPTNGYY